MRMLSRVLERLGDRDDLALATVVTASGSTPRHAGAAMIVAADGSAEGTIGGGRVELEVTREAAEVAAGAPARLVSHHLVRDLAMCCGGSMEVFIEPAAPSREAIAAALELRRARKPGALVTDLGGGGKRAEARDRSPPRPARDGDRFVEPVAPSERLILIGCGHVGGALGRVAAGLDFEVIACDDGDTGALDAPLPWADRVVPSFEIADLEAALGGLGAGDYVAIATRDHALDERLLGRLLPNDSLAYLGLIGSRRKLERFRRRLEAKEIATPERWERLSAPIGLDIGAETPEEIAIAIAAELVSVRRSRSP